MAARCLRWISRCGRIERNCVRVKECCHFKLRFLVDAAAISAKGEALLAAKALLRDRPHAVARERDGRKQTALDSTNGNCLIYESRPSVAAPISALAPYGPYTRREVI